VTRGALAVFLVPDTRAPTSGARVSVAGRRGAVVVANLMTVIIRYDDGQWDEVSSREAEEGR